MISVSKEWSLASRAMYGEDYVNGLAKFFQSYSVKNILECGCGDGNILLGLARRGFVCTGVDSNAEMIQLARTNSAHPSITYLLQDWLELKTGGGYDAVMCRGNSLPYVVSWDMPEFNPQVARHKIEESIDVFYGLLKDGGLLYVDAVPNVQLNQQSIDVQLVDENISLEGRIEHDVKKMTRKATGHGIISTQQFQGSTIGYLLFPEELERIMKKKAAQVFRPKVDGEIHYEVICGIK